MAFISGLEEFVQQDVPLAERTWFKLGGSAEYFASPGSLDALTTLVTRSREEELPIRLLGGGSNILIADTTLDSTTQDDERGGRFNTVGR